MKASNYLELGMLAGYAICLLSGWIIWKVFANRKTRKHLSSPAGDAKGAALMTASGPIDLTGHDNDLGRLAQ